MCGGHIFKWTLTTICVCILCHITLPSQSSFERQDHLDDLQFPRSVIAIYKAASSDLYCGSMCSAVNRCRSFAVNPTFETCVLYSDVFYVTSDAQISNGSCHFRIIYKPGMSYRTCILDCR